MKSLKELPDLPKFKLDSNRQIVIDDIEAEETAQEIEKQNENKKYQQMLKIQILQIMEIINRK